ncbi:MAG: S9 family peptidase [Bacteroidota bacterium]
MTKCLPNSRRMFSFSKITFALGLFACLLTGSAAIAQQKKQISLDQIWAGRTFASKSVDGFNWFGGGEFYTSQEDLAGGKSAIVKYRTATAAAVDTIVKSSELRLNASSEPISIGEYYFSDDRRKMIFVTEQKPIYRRSYTAVYYIFDLKTRKLTTLSDKGAQSYAAFSPDAEKVAFVRANNLFYKTLSTGAETQVTNTGTFNKIINGSADWVYEEEFSFAPAFFWNADSKKLAFYTFDESEVPVYNMQLWGALYPKDYTYKYPKAGEKNAVVSISVYDLPGAKTTPVDVGAEKDQYIARVNWTRDPNVLSLRRMNRLQNHIELLHADANTGKTTLIVDEKSNTYIDINDDLTYLENGKQFIYGSELNGYKHLFLYNMQGKLVKQITSGNWEVDDYKGYNEKTGLLYYTSTEVSPQTRHLYSIKADGSGKKLLTPARGTHRVEIAPDHSFFIDYFSTANTPQVVSLFTGAGKQVKMLEENEDLKKTMDGFSLGRKEFFTFKTTQGNELNGWTIKPSDFNPAKKYPVLMFVYGGPGDQQVTDSWSRAQDYFWYQMMAQKGYIIVCTDGRGTGGRGQDFKKATYLNLGKLECEDQIETAKYMATQAYVNKDRIGIWGWSFGGYMTALCMTKGADVFKAGISVAPVTNWRFYDSIYTERFLKTPQENPGGYDDNSPVFHAEKLKGKYLLIHGTGDDNVHFQNAVSMEDALIKANKQFETFYYPNRNHGIYGGNTRLHLYNMMTEFWLKNL